MNDRTLTPGTKTIPTSKDVTLLGDLQVWMKLLRDAVFSGNADISTRLQVQGEELLQRVSRAAASSPAIETGEYCDRRRHNFVKLPGGTVATCTYCNRPEPTTQKAEVQRTQVCDCDVGLCCKSNRRTNQYCRIDPPASNDGAV